MDHETSFQEMMRRYNRELMRIQRQAHGEAATGASHEKESPKEENARPAPKPEPIPFENTLEDDPFHGGILPRMEPNPPPVIPPTPPCEEEQPDCPCEKPENPCPPPSCDCCEPCAHCTCCDPCEPCLCESCSCEDLCEPIPCPPTSKPDCTDPLGCKVDKESFHSQTVGPRGPVLLQDTLLHETLETFVHREILERPIHIKGWGALGYFQPYACMKEYTTACFLQNPTKKTPVLVRFSQAGSNRGSPDTARDIRGFATKFYTDDGIFDIVGNHIPVFFIRDAMRFPETIAALSPSPKNNLPDPERFWDFIAHTPEGLHMTTWLYSDIGTVDSYRHIRGYGVNTFVWKNAAGKRYYVKYHWIPAAGERCLNREEAQRLAGESPDIAGEDLYNTIAKGCSVEYELCVQLMDPCDEETLPFDPLDDTKYWPESVYPLKPVGKMVLNRNPDNYNNQVEKAAFSPANLVPGIELSDDKMLQGRSFIYWDSQRRRLGPNFREIPVNCTPGWSLDNSLITSGEGLPACGTRIRAEAPKPDNFTQAGERYRGLPHTQQAHLVDNIAIELYVAAKETQRCVLGYFRAADNGFADRVMERMEYYSKLAKK